MRNRTIHCPWILAVALAVTGCTESRTDEKTTTPPPSQRSMGTEEHEFAQSPVPFSEFDCVRDTTEHYLQAQLPAGERLTLTSYSELVDATELDNLLAPIADSEEDSIGVTIHYGMDNSGVSGVPSMVFGLQLVVLHHVGETAAGRMYQGRPVEGGFYRISGKSLLSVDSTQWVDTYQRDYKAWVRIRRSNRTSTFETYAAGTDVTSYTLKYEGGLLDMIAHNPGITDLEIHALAEPMKRKEVDEGYVETGWWQIVALVGMDEHGSPMLDDDEHDEPFTMRALDLGSPCPPLCDLECVFPDKGMPVHPDCP